MCEEKDYYRVGSVAELGLTAARTASTAFVRVKQIIFLECYLSIFESGGIKKHFMTGPSGNIKFCFPPTSMFPSRLCLGEHWGSLRNRTQCFPRGQCLLTRAIGQYLCLKRYSDEYLRLHTRCERLFFLLAGDGPLRRRSSSTTTVAVMIN